MALKREDRRYKRAILALHSAQVRHDWYMRHRAVRYWKWYERKYGKLTPLKGVRSGADQGAAASY